MMAEHTVIAIDGPAASGKSSVSRALAKRMGFVYVNSGAMYRAVTWHVLAHNVAPTEDEAVVELLHRTKIDCGIENFEATMAINGIDPTPHLCTHAVNQNVSTIANVREVRRVLVEKQREFAREHDIVMEGRDIGSVVFPDTRYKFYIDASPEIRTRRRAAQGQQDEIGARDLFDSSRKMSPLIIAEDAHVIDSSNLTIDGVVGEVIGRLKMKGLQVPE